MMEMKNKIVVLLLGLFLCSLPSLGENRIAEADSAYNAKNYDKAIEIYKSVAENEGTSAPLLFNLGNAYYQNGEYGHAMLHWLRARRLSPRNEDRKSVV